MNGMPNMKTFILAGALGLAFSASAARATDMPEQFRHEHCVMCHSVDHKMVGPSYKDIAAKYKGDAKAFETLKKKVKEGGGGVWGAAKMPPHPNEPEDELDFMIKWILAL
jgi:cytochrome c